MKADLYLSEGHCLLVDGVQSESSKGSFEWVVPVTSSNLTNRQSYMSASLEVHVDFLCFHKLQPSLL